MTCKNKTKKRGGRNYLSWARQKIRNGIGTLPTLSRRRKNTQYNHTTVLGAKKLDPGTFNAEYKNEEYALKLKAANINEELARQTQIKSNGEVAKQLQHEENARQLQEQIKKTKINSIHDYLDTQEITLNKYNRNRLVNNILRKLNNNNTSTIENILISNNFNINNYKRPPIIKGPRKIEL